MAAFEEAYEDIDNVYIVTELCRGGELWHRIGEKHYSERTVRVTPSCIRSTLVLKPKNAQDLERNPVPEVSSALCHKWDE